MFDRTQVVDVTVAHPNPQTVTLRVLAPHHGKMGSRCEIPIEHAQLSWFLHGRKFTDRVA